MDTLGQIGEVTARLVDGELLRKENPDFHGYGHHYTDDSIPEKEIWLDASTDPTEILFFLLRALFEYELYARGLPDKEIREQALALDRALRSGQPPKGVKVKHLSQFGGLDAWLVRGDEVRKIFYPDFAQGGNGYRYDFIPKNEIWVEEKLPPDDRVFTLMHELYETTLMQGGMSYDSAHAQTTRLEKKLRDLVSVGQP
jgi:hypothetical protein